MAGPYYVYSGAAGAGTGADWANAFTTLTAAAAVDVAGDSIYVAHDHSESTAGAVTLNWAGTAAAPTKVFCVNRAGTVPPVAADLRTTAQVATSANNAIALNGLFVQYYGIIFVSGNSTGTASITICGTTANSSAQLINCSLQIGSTGGGKVTIGGGASGDGAFVDLLGTTVSFSGTAQGFTIGPARLLWRDTASAYVGTVVTTLYTFLASRAADVELRGVDLNGMSSGTIVGNVSSSGKFVAMDCKLNAGVTKAVATLSNGGMDVDFFRCGTSGVNYNYYRQRYSGALNEEITIVRTGGASDGTTPIAWAVATTANSDVQFPFETQPISIWNDVVSGATVTTTVQGIWGGGAVPNNNEIWMEVEYLGSATTPQASFASNGIATPLTAATGLAAGTGTWGGSTTKFALSVGIVPLQKGWILCRIKAATAATTFYIDPLVTLT